MTNNQKTTVILKRKANVSHGHGVHQPRAECFWHVDALELAAQLVTI